MLDALKSFFNRLRTNINGNALVLAGIALPTMVGMTGLAVEGGNWYQEKRAMQNAADTATLAAASNGSASFLTEARAVAAQYGYTNGVNNTTVAAVNNATCPVTGLTNCYRVTITRSVPLLFSQMVRYEGNATVNQTRVVGGVSTTTTRPALSLSSSSVATGGTTITRNYCLTALGTSATAIDTNGAPSAILSGCDLASKGGMDCSGHSLGATNGDSVGTGTGCATTQNNNMPAPTDPHATKNANIPAGACTATAATNTNISGTINADQTYCGNVTLTGNVTITGTNRVIIIRKGSLKLSGYDLITQVTPAASVTIIFTGTAGDGLGHNIVGGKRGSHNSLLNIQAPTTGLWSGIAIYQDPVLNGGVDFTYSGSGTTGQEWSISGLVYMPNAATIFSGSVNQSTAGSACTVFMVKSMRVNGSAGTLARSSQCAAAGLTLPSTTISSGTRSLVQ